MRVKPGRPVLNMKTCIIHVPQNVHHYKPKCEESKRETWVKHFQKKRTTAQVPSSIKGGGGGGGKAPPGKIF